MNSHLLKNNKHIICEYGQKNPTPFIEAKAIVTLTQNFPETHCLCPWGRGQ